MMSKMGTIFIMAFFSMVVAHISFAATCVDGTENIGNFECFTTKPGYICLDIGSGPMARNIMGSDCPLAQSVCEDYQEKCACDKYGYILRNGECVPSTCTSPSGVEISNQKCLDGEAQRCVDGQFVEDATCGCPIGEQTSKDGKTCVAVPNSCRWGTLECDIGYECVWVETNSKDEGYCKAQSGCAEFIPKETRFVCPSSKYCDTKEDERGVCKDRCGPKEVYNTGTKECEVNSPKNEDKQDDTISSPNTPTAGAITSDLACCCAPAVGIVSLAGLAIFRRE